MKYSHTEKEALMGSDNAMMNKNWTGSSETVDFPGGSFLQPVPKGRSREKAEWKSTVSRELSESSYALEHSTVTLRRVHPQVECSGDKCPVHQKTDHSMREFPQHFRDDRGFMERICPHGIGHPDPDDLYADSVHGCDGCCL